MINIKRTKKTVKNDPFERTYTIRYVSDFYAELLNCEEDTLYAYLIKTKHGNVTYGSTAYGAILNEFVNNTKELKYDFSHLSDPEWKRSGKIDHPDTPLADNFERADLFRIRTFFPAQHKHTGQAE